MRRIRYGSLESAGALDIYAEQSPFVGEKRA
jgi:hypothetical protein